MQFGGDFFLNQFCGHVDRVPFSIESGTYSMSLNVIFQQKLVLQLGTEIDGMMHLRFTWPLQQPSLVRSRCERLFL